MDSETFVKAIEKASPSIVRVDGRRGYSLSGVVWGEGVVVTTARAVEREENIAVTVEGETLLATLVGRDARSDLVVLKVEAELQALEFAPTDTLKVGHLVLTVGRPADSIQATLGMVSVLEGAWRSPGGGQIDAYLEVDARTFPGFSGGALLNLEGQALGINSFGLVRKTPLTIPTQTVQRVVEALLTHGRMRRGYLGVGGQPVRLPESAIEKAGGTYGLLLTSVEADSPAEKAGLSLGDTVMALEGKPVYQPAHLMALLDENSIGQTLTVRILRGGQTQELPVTILERP